MGSLQRNQKLKNFGDPTNFVSQHVWPTVVMKIFPLAAMFVPLVRIGFTWLVKEADPRDFSINTTQDYSFLFILLQTQQWYLIVIFSIV